MTELAALQESLDQVRQSLREQNARTVEQTAAMVEQTRKLTEVEDKLPGFVQRTGFRWAMAALALAGLLVAGFVVSNAATTRRFEREAIATDQAFCALTNRTFAEINKNRRANRQAYSLLVPSPGADPAAADRLVKFRDQLLATIDGDLPQLDCSGIGDGTVNFSLQDAIRNGTLPTPTTSAP